jgi:rhodanese-related sulfurtransferase
LVLGGQGSADYAGDVSPAEAWQAVRDKGESMIIDVRTRAEWNFVGIPDLGEAGKQPLLVEWQRYPTMEANPAFVDEVRAAGVEPGQPLYFLCRSGARSRAAAIAMTAAGFGPCYNIATGFEGDKDSEGHRGRSGGWKAEGLPWVQN